MLRFEDAKISKVVEAGETVACLQDRYAVCKVKKGFSADNTVAFEVGDTVICAYDIRDRIEVAYFGDFQKAEMSDFLTKNTLTPYSKYKITCSMETFRELFEPLDDETETFEAFLSGVKKHRAELSEARLPLDKAKAHYDKIATVRQSLTVWAMMSTAVAGAWAVWKFSPDSSATLHIYETAFLVMLCLIIGIVGLAGLFVGLWGETLDCFTVHHQPMVESAEKLYDAEVKNHSLELTDLRAQLF